MKGVLPSFRMSGDDPRPVGFVIETTDEHVQAAGRALTEVAHAVAAPPGAGPTLKVCFCSVRYVPALPFDLLSYHLVDFDDNGDPVDPVAAGEEVIYAVVVNQSVEVQREIGLFFMYDLLTRQIALHAPGVEAHQSDLIAARATEDAERDFKDRMRGGWAEAARALAARAREEGIGLDAKYRLDPFPEREALVRRMGPLREAYNSVPLAREFIDKTVSLIGGRDPRISVPGASDEVRVFAQRKLAEMGLRHYLTQTTRDAEVLGNGYLVIPDSPSASPYNLRPEAVEILGDKRFAVRKDGKSEPVEGFIMHLRGVEQFASPYGFSVLEVVLPLWISRRTLELVEQQTTEAIERLGDRAGEREKQYLYEVRDLVGRNRAATDERLGKLLWYPRDWLPDAVHGLYFPGQERM